MRLVSFALPLALALSFLAAPSGVAFAATYYVDNSSATCSDTGPGTEAQPYCTISAAVAARKGPNVTILVKPGIYRESVTIPASGSSGNPYVIQALGGTVVVDGADDFSSAAQWSQYAGNVYRASAVSWEPKQVFVDGARLSPSTASPGVIPTNSFVWVSGQGLYVNIGGSSPGTHNTSVGRRTKGIYLAARTYVTIDGFTVTHIEDRAIYLNTSSNNCIVRNNTCTWNYKYGVYATGCTGVLIEKNVTSDNQDHGLMLTNSSTTQSTNCTVQDNESMRNWYPTSRRATGLLVYNSPGNFIKRNLFHHNQDSGLQLDTGSNNCVSVQNISWSNGDHGYDQVSAAGCTHVGDVAYNNFKDGFSIEGTSPNSSTYDCIAVDNGLTTNEFDLWVNDASSPGFASDRNLFWNSTTRAPIKFITTQYSTIAAFTAATGRDAHSVQANPRFVNAPGGNFHLQSGSPAIDAADSSVPNWSSTDATGRSRFDDPATPNTGAGPVNYADMGALEYYNNFPPTASLSASPSSGAPPLAVTLDASGSQDSDGTIDTYQFDFGDGSPVVGPQASPITNHTFGAGTWTATVTVTDDGGAINSATTFINATANQKPNGTIDTPSVDMTIYAGQAVNFTGTGTDPDGNLPLTFQWNLGGGASNQTVEDPGPIIFNSAGTYTVSFVVTDALGGADPTPDTRVITVQPAPVGQPADEVHWTFMGQTAVSFDWRGFDSSLRYGLTPSYGQTVTGTTPTPLPWSSGGPFLEARITGLQENTTYHYSVGGGPDHTFHTPLPRGSSDFTVFAEGDIGDSVLFWRMARMQSTIAAGNPSFVLGVGDLSYANDFGQVHVDNHFNDVMVWSRDAAYMPVWGNHDNEYPDDDLRNYKGRFDLPNPQTSDAPPIDCCGEDWSWFDYGNVRFIAYPEPYTNNTWTSWNATATALMDQAQSDPAIRFIVTFGHRPAYSSGQHTGEGQLKNYLDALGAGHNKYVLNLNGHSHDYERSYPQNGVVHVTVGTGGAHLEQTTDPNCLWPQGCPPPPWSAYRAMHHGVLRMHVTSTEIQLAFLCGPAGDLTKNLNDVTCVEGSVLDSYTIGDQPPVVTAPPTASGAEGQALTINVTASDDDADPISSLTASGLPSGATFTAGSGNTSGTLTWTPNYDQAGTYVVTFTASNSLPGSASTTITVAGTDRAPVVTAAASAGALVNSPFTFNLSASDPDGDPISSLTADGLPAGATFTPGPGNATGTVSWTPSTDQAGSFTVTFTAQNALSGSAATVITVSPEARPPAVTAPATASVRASSLLTLNVAAADPDGEAITSFTADLSGLPAGATFTPSPDNSTGTLSWTPATPGGPYPVTFTAANAAAETGTATTMITVTQADQAPVVSAPATSSVGENNALTVTVNASDPEGDPITSLTASALPPGATFSAGSGNTSGTLSWTPTYAQAGSYTVTFTASNALSGSATTAITVTNVDRAPVVTAPGTASGKAATLITVNVTASDPDGESISSLSAATLPSGATFTPGSGNTTGTLSWTPTTGQVGTYTVTFTASNALSGSAATVITVNPPNTPPTASLILTPSSGNSPLAVTADASGSSDPDGSIVSYLFDFGDGSPLVGPQASAVAIHTYAAGTWTVTVTVTDNGGSTGSTTKSITVTNPPPTNLCGNPSFESNLNNWKAFASCTVSRVTGGSAGTYAAQSAATGTTTGSFGLNDSPDWVTNTTAAGKRYRFTAWVKSNTHTGTAKINVKEYLIATGALLGQVLTSGVTLSPTWQMITVDYTTTSAGSTLDFNIKDYPVVLNEVFLIDDVSIYDVTNQATSASLEPSALPAIDGVPGQTVVLQPRFFPDPFQSSATLSFATSRRGPLHVDLFDMAGRRVRQIVDDAEAPAGMHRFTIHGDQGGEPLRPGIYLYRIDALEGRRTGRVVMLR